MKKSPILWFLVSLSLVLGFLFREVFLSGMAGFANDAPLGLMQAYSAVRWDYFFSGSWLHNVWIGGPTLNTLPNFSHGVYLLGGALFYAKFSAVLSMAFAGVALWAFCRRQGFTPLASALPALAMALNGNLLSHATWGLPSRPATVAFATLALTAATPDPRRKGFYRWIWVILTGFATGMTVMEGADVGAFFSVLIAAYVAFNAWIETVPVGQRLLNSATRLVLVVACSVWIASLALTSLVGTQIQGVSGMGEDSAARQKRWEFVTGWSFPRLEVVRMAIPGIMGIRSVSPGDELYWGNVGSDGSPPRFNGGGEYVGILSLLVAAWALTRSMARSGHQPFSEMEQRRIGFWGVTALVTLLLSFGHYAPFYQLVFALPYFSTIRIPMKFLHLTHLAILILFAYGLQGLWRSHMGKQAGSDLGWGDCLKKWWNTATGHDRIWSRLWALIPILAIGLALTYKAFQPSLIQHLAGLGFKGTDGQSMASFSAQEVMLFAAFTTLSCFLLAGVAAGKLGGPSAIGGTVLLATLVVVDLGRAAAPFVLNFNYQRRYQGNVVTDFLSKNPWEHRVAARPHPEMRSTFSSPQDRTWPAVHNQWLENQMPYNGIQTLDIWQMPRKPELDELLLEGFAPKSEKDLALVGRLWDLTNVRYILGARGFQTELDRLFAGGKSVFKPILGFDLAAKSDTPGGNPTTLDDITAVPNKDGQYAIFENTRALPRVQWFGQWEIQTNNTQALDRLKQESLDPKVTVILSSSPGTPSSPAGQPKGTANLHQWGPKRAEIETESNAAGVLMLNERWHPDWKVTIDGQPAELLRANIAFRAVSVPAGKHTVIFHYHPSMRSFWVTLSAWILAVGLTLGIVRKSEDIPLSGTP